ncbi:transketolase [endosymbiont of Pachyrhynchus infernalis]|uniref:transketolase n=1 Tax=endosymbiont of Pachyrhynchus infernalis TaxID=1971488 RepID=UPI000DC71CB4|nr:transketolase [endosymbiont of Pachyrhynchus infernalis]BBA84902.1 transketolase 1 [endosymbiont of Pachyrhynchus infernalis]
MILRNILSNALRILSMDMVENAKSGHPGAPMGMSDIFEVLWRDFINHNPKNPKWINRDRFVLSNGHCSALLYSVLHLTGYNISISDLKNFRKLNSKTPGHPEYSHTEGIEVTTGPLGQGLANAVGFAIAEKTLSSQFNKNNFNIINHNTYVFVGDGCLMEGISHEVCSLAGKLKLNKLIVFYDKNNVSIDGNTENWFIDDTKNRFLSYDWNVININGHDSKSIFNSIYNAKKSNKPNLIICNTLIGYGSPNKCGDYKIHGTPLGKEESINTRKFLNWNYEPFYIPKEIYNEWNSVKVGIKKENNWNKMLFKYKLKFPELFNELNRRINKELPKDWNEYNEKIISDIKNNLENISTRKASQNVIEKFVSKLPELIGGSSDLTSSVLTNCSKSIPIDKFSYGNYINYGVREFGMTAINNGISIYNGFIPYGGTFLSFMDYAKSAVRMSALMKLRSIHIYSHDSVFIGEDGPTHQPVEQLDSLRLIPNLHIWRPFNQIETVIAWKYAIERLDGPTALILSRQNIYSNNLLINNIFNIYKGGYIVKSCNEYPDITIISTGSEIELSYNLYILLSKKKIKTRLVSIPSTSVFDLQNKSYYYDVLPKKSKKIIIEASYSNFWYKYLENNGKIIGIKTFGKSGSIDELHEYFGFKESNIFNDIKNLFN